MLKYILFFYHRCYIFFYYFDNVIIWWMKTWNNSNTVIERELIQNTNCISILLVEPFQIPSHHTAKPSQIFSFFDWSTEEPLCRSHPFKTLTQGGVDVALCLVQVQYGVCPQRKVSCTGHGKQLIIAVSWGYLVRGDTDECSCSHGVCERSTHAQRADKTVRKGTENIQGDLSCQDQQNKGGLG